MCAEANTDRRPFETVNEIFPRYDTVSPSCCYSKKYRSGKFTTKILFFTTEPIRKRDTTFLMAITAFAC